MGPHDHINKRIVVVHLLYQNVETSGADNASHVVQKKCVWVERGSLLVPALISISKHSDLRTPPAPPFLFAFTG